MPRITVQAINSDGEPRRWTLSERIIAANLDSDHYAEQLIERLAWATVDAEIAEARDDDHDAAGHHQRGAPTTRPRGDRRAARSRPRGTSPISARTARA